MSDHTVNVHAGKKDVLWNYVGTFMSMASNFLLIPLLLVFLSSEEIGYGTYSLQSPGLHSFLNSVSPPLSQGIYYSVYLASVSYLNKDGTLTRLAEKWIGI